MYEVVIPDQVLISVALPYGYVVNGEGPVFNINLRAVEVAKASIKDGLVVFEFYDTDLSSLFKVDLFKKFPDYVANS